MQITPICCELFAGCCYSTLHLPTRVLKLELAGAAALAAKQVTLAGVGVASGSFPGMTISALDYADAVYVDLSVLFPPQDNSVAVAAGRVMLETERQRAVVAQHTIFVNLLLKMPLARFQLARSAKP